MQAPRLFKILLIGDSCEDVYVYGEVSRLNPEAPVPILDFKRVEKKPGMCLNVELNLKSFGLDVTTITNSEKIRKTRYCDQKFNQQLLRLDEQEFVKPVDLSFVDYDQYDAIVISDYNKGFINDNDIILITHNSNCPVFIDTKKTSMLNTCVNCYVKINELESKKFNGSVKNLIVTLGENGAMYNGIIYPTRKVETRDIVGAGDTFLAALTYGFLQFGNIEKAIKLANLAAGISVGHPGTYVLNQKDVERIIDLCN